MSITLNRLVIIGTGLIGGSIARAARERGVAGEVVGVVRSEASRRRAVDSGVVKNATTDLADVAGDADMVIACTPVGDVAPTLLTAAKACPASAVLTDAGSTKAGIVEEVEAGLAGLDSPPTFVGSHPLAGDHRTGPESARADLLEGRKVVVTPTTSTQASSQERVTQFWESLGAEVVVMAPEAHDRALAHTSHLPHVLAKALALTTPADALPLTATGWRDTTRVAAGSAALWRDIVLANRPPLLASLDEFAKQLNGFRDALTAGDADAIEHFLEQGRRRRDAVGD